MDRENYIHRGKPSGTYKYTAKQVIEAIQGSRGLKSVIAKNLGCSWGTVDNYIRNWPTVTRAYRDEIERVNDLAQNTVLRAIAEGDVQTARWWLTKMRRGDFGDTLDVTSGGRPITVEQMVTYAKLLGLVIREYVDDPDTLAKIYADFEAKAKRLISSESE